jgi:hypothetical protein
MGFFGFLVLCTGIVCLVLARRTARQLRAVAGAERLTIGELLALHEAAVQAAGPGHFRLTCELQGTILPGPNGLLRSDLADVECVWHTHAMVRPNLEVGSDGQPKLRGMGISFLSTFSSDQSFCLDDGTGQVLVRPFASSSATSLKDRTRVSTMPDITEQVMGEEDPSAGELNRGFEWVIRPGQTAFVLGEVSDAGGELVMDRPAGDGPYLMSRQSQAGRVESRHRTHTMLLVFGAVGCILGLLLILVGCSI